jgi:hypothetical protein
MSPELVVALFRSFAQDDELQPAQALLDLIEVLARTHATMDNDDWEVIATAGALLWRAEMGEIEAEATFEMLMRRLRK